jgi:hypothetical protein
MLLPRAAVAAVAAAPLLPLLPHLLLLLLPLPPPQLSPCGAAGACNRTKICFTLQCHSSKRLVWNSDPPPGPPQ